MRQDIFVLLPAAVPAAAGVFTLLGGRWIRCRRMKLWLVFAVLLAAMALTAAAALRPDGTFTIWRLTEHIVLEFKTDGVGRIFACLTAAVFLASGVYSFEYLKQEENENRFLGFYLLLLGVLLALDFAASLPAFYVCFELMTLASFPLVLHEMTREAVFAGLKYLFYSVAGAFAALFGILFLAHLWGDLSFRPGGIAGTAVLGGERNLFLAAVFLLILGFGTKAGMFPMHGWLPTAHPAAPAPASAVLSGIITKSGVLALIRVIYFVAGPASISGTWVQGAWIVLSLATVFMGSMLAYGERVMKKRLAYSTVSQVAYILFGLSLLHPVAFAGAMAQVVFHALAKTGLFLAAGAVIFKTGKRQAADYAGLGRRLPVTFACFGAGALTLVGIPPAGGFLSKWYLAQGALAAPVGVASVLGPVILLVSALLTAGYLFPPVMRGFLPGNDAAGRADGEENGAQAAGGDGRRGGEPLLMTVPMVILFLLALFLGLFPGPLLEAVKSAAAGLFEGGVGI